MDAACDLPAFVVFGMFNWFFDICTRQVMKRHGGMLQIEKSMSLAIVCHVFSTIERSHLDIAHNVSVMLCTLCMVNAYFPSDEVPAEILPMLTHFP